jgi:16S rRNA (uracil1498-N3)-methyltransferase
VTSAATGWAAAFGAVAHAFVGDLDATCRVTGEDGHHLARVRRLRAGETVTAADGRGAWRPYRVESVDRGAVALEADGPVRVEPRLEPTLAVAFALTKADKPERVVQQLTELGVDRILPVVAVRSVVRWEELRGERAVHRVRRGARAAAMQSHRARRPEVEPVTPLAALAGRPGLVLARRGEPAGAAKGAPNAGRPAGPEWLAVIGPEGGLTDAEVAGLGAAVELGVGPHVLRAETAAVSVAAVLTRLRAPTPPP